MYSFQAQEGARSQRQPLLPFPPPPRPELPPGLPSPVHSHLPTTLHNTYCCWLLSGCQQVQRPSTDWHWHPCQRLSPRLPAHIYSKFVMAIAGAAQGLATGMGLGPQSVCLLGEKTPYTIPLFRCHVDIFSLSGDLAMLSPDWAQHSSLCANSQAL